MKITDLKKALNAMEKPELVSLICTAYKNSDFVYRQVELLLSGERAERELLEDFKRYIHETFFEIELSLRTAKGYISDFKKLCGKPEYQADLMLYYVECGVEFTNTYGDIDERFYDSVVLMFNNFANLLHTLPESVCKKFGQRVRRVHDNSQDIGWGFTDGMNEVFSQISDIIGDEGDE